MAYVAMGVVVVLTGVGITVVISALDPNMSIAMGTGLLSGSLTSTPAFSAARESAGALAGEVTAGYGIGFSAAVDAATENVARITLGHAIAYPFGVVGVVLFVQIMPKLLKVDIAKERESFVAANTIHIPDDGKKRVEIDEFGFFPFFLTIVLGLLIGCIKVPIGGGNYFSFGSSGGTLIAGLIVGHFGKVGPISLKVSKQTLNFFRELGLILFLVGAGIPGGADFVANFDPMYFVYGMIMTVLPLIIGYFFAKYVLKLSLLNSLGSLTGGMTSTPALGTLISTAGTEDVAAAYAATYPIALIAVVLVSQLIVIMF